MGGRVYVAVVVVTGALLALVAGEVLQAQLVEASAVWWGRLRELLRPPDLTWPWTYVILAALLYTGRQAHVLLFRPLNRVRLLGDLGYATQGKMKMKALSRAVQRSRLVGETPPVYPNGWFAVGETHSLAKGEVQNFVCLVPDVARVKSYPCVEKNGFVYIWYHAEGAEPQWTPPDIPEIASGEWVYRGRTEHYLNAHIEEVPENGADVAHLEVLHSPLMTAGVDIRYMYSKYWAFGAHLWGAEWNQNPPPEGHIGTMKLTHTLKLFGVPLRFLDMDVTAQQIGPGLVYLTWECGVGRGAYLQSLTPVGPLTQRMVHHVYMQPRVPALAAKFMLLGEALMVERDIMIWNNKKYNKQPVMTRSAEDAMIIRHRRWYSQFYSEHSPRLRDVQQGMDW